MTKSFSKFLFVIILFLVFPMASFAQVVINEIFYSSSSKQWIEIYNNTDGEIDLTKYKIKDAGVVNGHNIVSAVSGGSNIIPAHAYGVIAKDITSVSATYLFHSALGIATMGDTVILKNNDNPAVDVDTVLVPLNSAINSNSLQLQTDGTWIATSPTPGAINATVSNNASNDTNSDNQNTSGEVLGASSGSSSSSSSTASSGGSTTDKVSSLNAQLEILAGSDRATSPGSPIWFQATVKKNTTGASPELNWSFGDGNVGVGPLVSHTYKYPGDYAVVLSAGAGDIFSVSRLKVKVAESNISVSDGGEYLEISNNGNTEINLFNWKIENKGKGFIFQPNTIVLSKSSIKLDKSLLTMKGLDNSLGTSLRNSLKEEVFAIALVKEIDLKEVSKNLDNIKKEFSVVQEKVNSLGFVSDIPKNNTNFYTQSANVFSAVSTNEKIETDSINSPRATTSAENIIYEAPKSPGIFSRTWNFSIGMLH